MSSSFKLKSYLPILLVGVLGTLPLHAVSKDFGVQGSTYKIVEKDVRELMVESAIDTDWSKAQEELKDSAKNYTANLTKRYLETAESTSVLWIDPSIELSSDIQAPVEQADGSIQWEVLYAKGTRVNPLEKFTPPTTMVFFNGADESQVKWVKGLLEADSYKFVPVEAGSGNVGDDSKALGRPVFYASDAMLSRFQISKVPSMLFAGNEAHKLELGLLMIAPPFDSNLTLKEWTKLSNSGSAGAIR